MEPEEEKLYNPRKFGYIHILWDIENYFFVTYQKKWEIYSPPFNVSGSYFTTWRFILKANKIDDAEDYVASIYLERLPSDGFTGPVRVSWHLWHSYGSPNVTICENEGIFERECYLSVRIKNFKALEGWLQMISSDKFTIECAILVNTTEDTKIFQRSKDIGLRTLSRDLYVLSNIKVYSDLKINIDGMSLECHKAIVSARSKKLEEAIDRHSEASNIKLDYRSNKSISKVISYLYSGNFEHILRIPTIYIDQDISYFRIKELEEFYLKDVLNLRTTFEACEFCFKWIIKDINSGNRKFLSPHFGNRNLNITFRIRLELNEECDQNVDIFLEIVEASVPEELYIKYDILDITGISVHLSAQRWSFEEGGNLGIKNSLSRTVLKEPSVVGNGELCILCTLFVPTGESDLRVVKSRYCFLSSLNHEEHYSLLSKQISTLFETGKHSDLSIKCNKTRFRVHKCIISARSPALATAIGNLKDRQHAFIIDKFEPNIMRIVLDYMYSGILRNYELSDIFDIHSTAEFFRMTILTYQCCEILEDNLQIQNVLQALTLAHYGKHFKLKISSFKFIMHNSKEISQQENWGKLKENRSLFEELKNYIRTYERNNRGEVLKLDEDFEVELYLEPIQPR